MGLVVHHHLLHVVFVILQAEIDVGLHAAELDRRPIVRPAEVDRQTEQKIRILSPAAAIGGELDMGVGEQTGGQ